ncbi:MAG: hypothetical protein ACK2UW_20065 [Anaerolineales bacterium]|jgi:hypothetical protein
MYKKAMILMVVLMLLLVSMTAASAMPKDAERIDCVIDITYDPEIGAYWQGPVTGCALAGTIRFVESPDNYSADGKEYFFEDFTIWPDSGGVIYGKDAGVWDFATFKFHAKGEVTDASGKWADLVGYKFVEMGRTSDPEVLPLRGPNTAMTLYTH